MKHIQILIVEDEPAMAFVLNRQVERSGFSVCGIVSSSEDALRFFHAHQPHIILMDFHILGLMNGFETAREIHKHRPVPIIMMSATLSHEIENIINHTPNLYFLPKPAETINLVQMIKRCLSIQD
ncbi:MAG: response regulator [Bacteroidia bacterium]|nr:response regulator [Bacteroidia bacterium]MDW8345969.1 response regulator [Bacteroidia bacterium]